MEQSVQSDPKSLCLLVHVQPGDAENPLESFSLQICCYSVPLFLDLNNFFDNVEITGHVVVVRGSDSFQAVLAKFLSQNFIVELNMG